MFEVKDLWMTSGIAQSELGQLVMMIVALSLLFLAIKKRFEPLLLVPIGFGTLLVNIPGSGFEAAPVYDALGNLQTPGGLLYYIYSAGIATGLFPLIIFMGVGAMTDFSALLANPKTLLLGAAAQVGIFTTVMGAAALGDFGFLDFSIRDAASIGIIGGADGPTSIFVASRLSPDLLGAIAVAAYSYMALVPIIQPPIMRALTNQDERQLVMDQLRHVSPTERVIFPLMLILLVALFLPEASPLIGMFCFGNLMRECGVVERLSDTTQNSLINIVTIFLGLGVGSKMSAEKFLNAETLGILALGAFAFCVGTAAGVLMAKGMNFMCRQKINPLIGAAGVSAVPMAARVVNKVGLEANPKNILLMHAMGPNVAGVIGSAIAAGVLINIVGGSISG